MSIDVSKLRDAMERTLGSSGTGFDEMIVSSVNDVSRDLRSRTMLSFSINGDDGEYADRIDNIIDLDKKYISVYKDGIRYYLGLAGEWGRKPDKNAFMQYQLAMAQAQREAMIDEDPDIGFIR